MNESENNKTVFEKLDDVAQGVETVFKHGLEKVDSLIKPQREAVFFRYPLLFTLLVTFGVAAVFFGFEKILSNSVYLSEHPWQILLIGVLVLAFTGQLYKKLK